MRVLEREDADVYFGRAGAVQGVRAVLQRTHHRDRKTDLFHQWEPVGPTAAYLTIYNGDPESN